MKIYLLIILLTFLSNLTHSIEFDDKLELAKQGDAFAQAKLGSMYFTGRGVQQDYKAAVMWYTKAAEQGSAKAQGTLALMYAMGKGVPESDIKAYVWGSMAKANGNQIAKDYIEGLKKRMTKEQIAKAQEIGSKCYESDYKDCN